MSSFNTLFNTKPEAPDEMPTPWRHQNGGYYLLRRVPKDLLRAYAPATQVQRSLRTKDRREAEDRICVAWLKLKQEWALKRRELASSTPLSPELGTALAKYWHAEALEADEERLHSRRAAPPLQWP